MKKLCVLFSLVLLLTLAACAPTTLPGGSMPETQSTTAPPTKPPTDPPTEPPTEPPTDPIVGQPPFSELYIFQYEGDRPIYRESVTSVCKWMHLYYYDASTDTVTAICDEKVNIYTNDNSHFYFVKSSEPNKLFCAPLTDLTQQTVIYESDFGAINDIWAEQSGVYKDKVVTLTEGNKRGVVLDLATGDITVVIEQYYLEITQCALVESNGKLSWDRIWFRGIPNEGDRNYDYFLWPDGTITLMEDG